MKIPSTSPARESLARMRRSIRTRYAAATAFFLLLILAVFYVGGRIMLVHLVKDTETQVHSIGSDINAIAQHDAAQIRTYVTQFASAAPSRSLDSFLGPQNGVNIALAIQLSPHGAFEAGRLLLPNTTNTTDVSTDDMARYASALPQWANGKTPSGILRLGEQSFSAAAVQRPDGRSLILGMPFHSDLFTTRLRANFNNSEIKIADRDLPAALSHVRPSRNRPSTKKEHGLGPFVSVAMDYYSGGFWQLGDNAFEAVYTIRDIVGNAVSMISVSLPQTFSNAAGLAITRLTLFVAVVGLVLVIPIFWFQSRILLNPLSRMTDCVRRARERCGEADCPRLDWRGDDEFAELAFSVNALLEAITNRTLAIAQVENRQKALINGLPDGLMIFGRDHQLVTIIKQPSDTPAIPGFTEKAPIDVMVFGRDGVENFGKAIDDAFKTEKPGMLTLEAGTRPRTRWFDVRLSLTDHMFVLAIVRDITESMLERKRRRAVETRLQHVHKQESLTLFAGSIAHDVNNILAAVLNTAEITFMDARDPETVVALNTIRDAVKRGSAMTRELMTFAGETRIVFQRLDPSQLVRDVSNLAEGVVTGNVNVVYDLPEGLPAVDADPDQFWKVFFNLAKNASEAMDGIGEIRVSTRRFEMTDDIAAYYFSSKPIPPGPGVLFTISDNGPGIPKDMLRRIFDPYVSTKSSGRGFGLATVNTIVDAHHGGVRVESVPGHGTTFSIFLPVSKTAHVRALPPRPDAPVPVEPHPSVTKEILLIDDDPAILKTTSILLKALSYTVHTASNQGDATECVRRRASHLACVILDAHLQTSDPTRIISVCRASAPNIPIVVSSGTAVETVQKMFATQPYNAFLAKPYTLADLKSVLASV